MMNEGCVVFGPHFLYVNLAKFRYRERLRGMVTVPMQCNNVGHKYEYFLLVQNFCGLLNIIQLPNGESQNI